MRHSWHATRQPCSIILAPSGHSSRGVLLAGVRGGRSAKGAAARGAAPAAAAPPTGGRLIGTPSELPLPVGPVKCPIAAHLRPFDRSRAPALLELGARVWGRRQTSERAGRSLTRCAAFA